MVKWGVFMVTHERSSKVVARAFIGFLLGMMSFYACATVQYPLTVKDGLGRTVIISKEPQRISSKTLFTDEVLIGLKASSRLVSLTNVANDPNYSLISKQLPKGIPLVDLNVEMMMFNQPDIVFVAGWSNLVKLEQLAAMGITVYCLPELTTVSDIKKEIEQLGTILNREKGARALVDAMVQRLKTEITIPTHPLTVLDYNPWGMSNTDNSSWGTVLKQAQAVNAITKMDRSGNRYGQVPISKEAIIVLNPDVIFIPDWLDKKGSGKADSFKKQVLSDPLLQSVNAIKNKRVYHIPQALKGTNSHHIVDAIVFVNQALYQKDSDSL